MTTTTTKRCEDNHAGENLPDPKTACIFLSDYAACLLGCGATCIRIEKNVRRMAERWELLSEMTILPSHIHMTVWNKDRSHSYSNIVRLRHTGISFNINTQLSKLSWAIADNKTNFEKARRTYRAITDTRPANKWLVWLLASLANMSFCRLFGGDWVAFFLASLCAYAGFEVRAQCIKFGINHYMCMAIAAFVSTCLAYGTTLFGWSATPYHPLLACALFIVPGVPLINFVDDMIDNFLLVGITRAANTAMMLGALTFGIAFALRIFQMSDVQIDLKFSELSMEPHDSYYVYAIAAAIAAMGFSMIFNIQRRLLWVVALGGIIAVCTRNFVNFGLGYGPVIGSFMGSFVVSLIAVKAVHWFHVPNHVLTIPSVIPMIPGVLMYRSLLAFINMHGVIGEVTHAFANGINSALIILCISLGVAVPNIFARRYIAKDRQRFLEEELRKRKERGKFIEW